MVYFWFFVFYVCVCVWFGVFFNVAQRDNKGGLAENYQLKMVVKEHKVLWAFFIPYFLVLAHVPSSMGGDANNTCRFTKAVIPLLQIITACKDHSNLNTQQIHCYRANAYFYVESF